MVRMARTRAAPGLYQRVVLGVGEAQVVFVGAFEQYGAGSRQQHVHGADDNLGGGTAHGAEVLYVAQVVVGYFGGVGKGAVGVGFRLIGQGVVKVGFRLGSGRHLVVLQVGAHAVKPL